MAATILAKEVLYRASAQLLDVFSSATQFKRWTEKELLGWLNDGQRVIAKFLPSACSRIDAVKLAAGTRQSIDKITAANIIHGDGSTSADQRGRILLDVIRNMGVDGATAGRAVRPVERESLDGADPLWHRSSASEVSEYVFDPRNPKFFYVNPGVIGATAVWVEISYLATPAEIPYVAGSMVFDGSSTALISIDDQFVDDLVNYICARALLRESDEASSAQLAGLYVNQFVASINSQAKVLTGVNPNLKMLPFEPSTLGAAS